MQCISGGEFSHLCYVITFLNLREWMTNTLKIILISDLIYGIFCICTLQNPFSNPTASAILKQRKKPLHWVPSCQPPLETFIKSIFLNPSQIY